jgi:hypothetical protein
LIQLDEYKSALSNFNVALSQAESAQDIETIASWTHQSSLVKARSGEVQNALEHLDLVNHFGSLSFSTSIDWYVTFISSFLSQASCFLASIFQNLNRATVFQKILLIKLCQFAVPILQINDSFQVPQMMLPSPVNLDLELIIFKHLCRDPSLPKSVI